MSSPSGNNNGGRPRRTASQPALSRASQYLDLRVITNTQHLLPLAAGARSRDALKQFVEEEFVSADAHGWTPHYNKEAAAKAMGYAVGKAAASAASAATSAAAADDDRFHVYNEQAFLALRKQQQLPPLSGSMQSLLRAICVSTSSGSDAAPASSSSSSLSLSPPPSSNRHLQHHASSPPPPGTQLHTITVGGAQISLPVPISPQQARHGARDAAAAAGAAVSPGPSSSSGGGGSRDAMLPMFGTNVVTGPPTRKRYFSAPAFHHKILALLNKVSDDEDKFAGICRELLCDLPWAQIAKHSVENTAEMKEVCTHFIDKACAEPKFVKHYARLANCIVGAPELNIGIKEDPPAATNAAGADAGVSAAAAAAAVSVEAKEQQLGIGARFRSHLLNRAQAVFTGFFEGEQARLHLMRRRQISRAGQIREDGDEDEENGAAHSFAPCTVDDEQFMTEEEIETRAAAKKRLVGIVRFASELYLSGVLTRAESIAGIVAALVEPIEKLVDHEEAAANAASSGNRGGEEQPERVYHMSEVQCSALSVLFECCGEVFAGSEPGMRSGVPMAMSNALVESETHPKPRARFLMMNVRDRLQPFAASLYPQWFGDGAGDGASGNDGMQLQQQQQYYDPHQHQQGAAGGYYAANNNNNGEPQQHQYQQNTQQQQQQQPQQQKFSHLRLDAVMQSVMEQEDVSLALPAVAQQADPLFFLSSWLLRILKKSSLVPLRYNFGELLSRCVEAHLIHLRDADFIIDKVLDAVCAEMLWVDVPHLWDIWATVVASGAHRLVRIEDVEDEYELNFDEDPRDSLRRYYHRRMSAANTSASASGNDNSGSAVDAATSPLGRTPQRTSSVEDLSTAAAVATIASHSPIRFFDAPHNRHPNNNNNNNNADPDATPLGQQRCTVLLHPSWHNHMLTRVLEAVLRDVEGDDDLLRDGLSVARRFIESVARCTEAHPQSLWNVPVLVWRCRPPPSMSSATTERAAASARSAAVPPRICAPRFRFLAVLARFAPHADIEGFLRHVVTNSAVLQNISIEAQLFHSLVSGINPSINVLGRHPYAASPVMAMVVIGTVVAACAALKNEKYRALPAWLLSAVDGARRVQREALALHELAASGAWVGFQMPFMNFGWRFTSFMREALILSDDVVDAVRASWKAAADAAAMYYDNGRLYNDMPGHHQHDPQQHAGDDPRRDPTAADPYNNFYSQLDVMLGPNTAQVRAINVEAAKQIRAQMLLQARR